MICKNTALPSFVNYLSEQSGKQIFNFLDVFLCVLQRSVNVIHFLAFHAMQLHDIRLPFL